ncbi:hypothetical protein CH63R_12501 [Colletotrichum higginsianum IMI 349063]|uniref:Uncharacterized protein n=1 Tax=Colletotrichum higginsianum (strain IMI 349063) TaxID=759273 RepID=A0A1B7XUG1_COLHI|nr:hypothetical protein CH63R_12501 [Colletotrichum higginsianum IMI 349063]OBR03374.1 hypothetical protein CH63R_12501 [Colletotrichum higginsianum IMI 349063]
MLTYRVHSTHYTALNSINNILSTTDRPPPTNGQRSITFQVLTVLQPVLVLRLGNSPAPGSNFVPRGRGSRASHAPYPYGYTIVDTGPVRIPMNDARRDAIRLPGRLKLSSRRTGGIAVGLRHKARGKRGEGREAIHTLGTWCRFVAISSISTISCSLARSPPRAVGQDKEQEHPTLL